MWLVFIAFYFVFGAASYLLRRVLAQKLPNKNRLINASFFIIFLLPAALVLGLLFPHNLAIGWVNLALLLGGSLIWPVFNILAYRANKDIDVGVYTVINNLSPIFTLIVALTVLDESLNTNVLIGIFLLLISGVVVASPQLKQHKHTSKSGIIFALISTAVLGFAVAYEKFMLNRVDLGTYFLIGWTSQIAWMAYLSRKDLKELPSLIRGEETKKTVLGYGLTNVLKSMCFILALKYSASAAVVGATTDFMSVVVIIAAYFILHERSYLLVKLLAALLGIAGLLLVAS